MVSHTVSINVNLAVIAIFIVGLFFRLWRLDHPHSIVFDEIHYGKFISMYIKGIFYFDSQPPLGKQIVSVVSYLAGFTGNANFTSIGSQYDQSIPIKSLRIIPAISGSLIGPLMYGISRELGLSETSSLLAAIFYLCENSFLTQSRFLLMDMIQIAFSLTGLYFTMKSRSVQVLSTSWFVNILASGIFLALGCCVRYCGLYTLILSVIIVLYDFWWLIPDNKISVKQLWLHSLTYLFSFILLPIIVYLGIFYLHLSWLTKAGPHDNILTSAFQASLEGGLASITKGQPLEVVHGSQITLRHTHGRACWLHSHAQVYPVKYTDGRGSSHQQQVTCYSFKDVNNWWIVKKPQYDDVVVQEPLERIRNGDIIQLLHGMTGRSLNSHDVAAPMSPHSQEVSCYINYNISMPSQNLWRVNLINSDETNGVWHTIRSHVRLVHLNSSQVLKFSGKQLPDWGYNQHEIVADRIIDSEDSIWNVEEHRYTRDSEQKDRERDMIKAEFVPLEPTVLDFWSKMREIQYKMILGNIDKVESHMYESNSPVDWLFLTNGIAYWIDSKSNSQVFLIGNIFLWFSSLIAMIAYVIVFVVYLCRRRRLCFDLKDDDWNIFTMRLLVFLSGYLLNYLPYFFVERTLFLYFYLPSLVFKYLLMASFIEYLTPRIHSAPRLLVELKEYMKLVYRNATLEQENGHLANGKDHSGRKKCQISKSNGTNESNLSQEKYHILSLSNVLIVSIISIFIYAFIKLLPLSYGSGQLTSLDVESMRWRKSWLFIIHTK